MPGDQRCTQPSGRGWDEQTDGTEGLRHHSTGRLCEEARDQGGLLTQEDLAQILSCHPRTNRRDVKALKELGVHIPTRGQQKDIGATLTNKDVAIRHWLGAKEPQEVARAINHSLRAVDRYLIHFARIMLLRLAGSRLPPALGSSSKGSTKAPIQATLSPCQPHELTISPVSPDTRHTAGQVPDFIYTLKTPKFCHKLHTVTFTYQAVGVAITSIIRMAVLTP